MLTVPEAARRVNRNPETVRRWIRQGKLQSQRIGTQHLIDERELDALVEDDHEMLALPDEWKTEPQINWVRLVHLTRQGR